MDFGEAIAVGIVQDAAVKCPFKMTGPEVSSVEPENPPDDDRPAARKIQANNGGTLGKNLGQVSPDCDGAAGTVNDVKRPPKRRKAEPKRDSSTDKKLKVYVYVDKERYPWKVAAHHCIPGNASLKRATDLRKFMEKGKKITSTLGKKYTIKQHIGYNINGAHNGVWLPGNYAIRKNSSPKKKTSWGALASDPAWEDWCYAYMIACTRAANGQFHDSHPNYSDNVYEVLTKIADMLGLHLDSCKDCEGKAGGQVYPPYFLKNWLYALSGQLKTKCKVKPPKILFPWCTSDAFSDQMRKAGAAKNAIGFTG